MQRLVFNHRHPENLAERCECNSILLAVLSCYAHTHTRALPVCFSRDLEFISRLYRSPFPAQTDVGSLTKTGIPCKKNNTQPHDLFFNLDYRPLRYEDVCPLIISIYRISPKFCLRFYFESPTLLRWVDFSFISIADVISHFRGPLLILPPPSYLHTAPPPPPYHTPFTFPVFVYQ